MHTYILMAYITTTHSIYLVLFIWFFSLSAVGCMLLSVANSHVALLSGSIHCDDAYSYGDNFIYLYSHYDLSMWCHNKGFNEFNSLAHCHMSLHHFVEECWWISKSCVWLYNGLFFGLSFARKFEFLLCVCLSTVFYVSSDSLSVRDLEMP